MLTVATLTLVVGLAAGFAFGQRQGLGMGMGFVEAETTGVLNIHVEVASCIRVGDTDRALKLLDGIIDSGVVGLQAQPDSPRAERVQRAIADASAYRSAVRTMGADAVAVQPNPQDVSEAKSPGSGFRRLIARTGK